MYMVYPYITGLLFWLLQLDTQGKTSFHMIAAGFFYCAVNSV